MITSFSALTCSSVMDAMLAKGASELPEDRFTGGPL